jgi:hypothetical protein
VLVEAVGDLVPTAVAFVTMLAVFILGAATLGWRSQVLLLLGLPLLVGWLLFQGPLLALGTRGGLLSILRQRLPQAWVAANLGMAGISVVAGPLLPTCPLLPLPSWTVISCWAMAALGAPAGARLLRAYESWAVHRGLQACAGLAQDLVVDPAELRRPVRGPRRQRADPATAVRLNHRSGIPSRPRSGSAARVSVDPTLQ